MKFEKAKVIDFILFTVMKYIKYMKYMKYTKKFKIFKRRLDEHLKDALEFEMLSKKNKQKQIDK